MSGIYLHIPFCKQACHYCNFHFSTSLHLKEDLVSAICREISLRSDFLDNRQLTSIYFGGGTPSLLNREDLSKIFSELSQHYTWSTDTEITLEANPDDISEASCTMWKEFGINRLSIGIQSFHDIDLKYMNRAHDAAEAHKSLVIATHHGFDNLSIDLIYGSPTTTHDMWIDNISKVINLAPHHISAYALTVEDKTALAHQVKKNPMLMPDQGNAAIQFETLVSELTKAGYDHYEISNFAKVDHYAIHNTNYWRGISYLGIGPSAHSYDGQNRFWNIANNARYIDAINKNILPIDQENLTSADRYNELVMTGLRTMWGVNLVSIKGIGEQFLQHFLALAPSLIAQDKLITQDGQVYTLTSSGKHFADRIASDLFWVAD